MTQKYTLSVPVEKSPGRWRRRIVDEAELRSFITAFLNGTVHSDRCYIEKHTGGELESVVTGSPF